MPFGKIYSEWNIAKEGGQDLFVGFYRLLEENKTRTLKKEKPLHVNTQFYYLKTLRYCLNRAVSEDYITVNPMNKIKNEDKPKRNRTERDYLTIKELTRLVHTFSITTNSWNSRINCSLSWQKARSATLNRFDTNSPKRLRVYR